MKKHLILVGVITTVLTTTGAHAVTKCVKLTSSTTCSNSSAGGSNWTANCGDIKIQGVAFCGSQDGGSVGATTSFVQTNYISDNNKYCWCKMVSPAVSLWIFYDEFTSAGVCINSCASYCMNTARSSVTFRRKMFGSLSD